MVGEHCFPTDLIRNSDACQQRGTTGICNCSFDGVGSILTHILPEIKPKDLNWSKWGQIYQFDQSEFLENPNAFGMDETGFVFIPYNCALKSCKVHVAFHGCGEQKEILGDVYVKNTGYLE
jgi:hypothetical protein